jgi:hypothetical protein
MKTEQRKKKIERLRDKGLTYEEIGLQFKISAERVRQILTHKVEYCHEHKRQFIGVCSYCVVQNDYVDKLHHIVKDGLIKEITALIIPDRSREQVMKRIAMIRLLRDKYLLPFSRIANLLKRDITSVKNLYNNKIK